MNAIVGSCRDNPWWLRLFSVEAPGRMQFSNLVVEKVEGAEFRVSMGVGLRVIQLGRYEAAAKDWV